MIRSKNLSSLTLMLALLVFSALTLRTAMAAESSLPGGTPIGVTIDNPADGTEITLPPDQTSVDVTVSGSAFIGESSPIPDMTLIYVLDGSPSVADLADADCGPDQQTADPESVEDQIIDCEIVAAINLNNQVISLDVIDEVAMIMFAGDAVTADATPAGGDDPLIAPEANANGNSLNDVDEVLQSIKIATTFSQESGFDLFTDKPTPDVSGTNYANAISEALDIAALATNPNVVVVFISDGESNVGNPVADVLSATDAVFHTFAISNLEDGCDTDPEGKGSLQDIADLTGGVCTEVEDPSMLPDVLPSIIIPTLDSFEIEVNGGGARTIDNADIDPDLPQEGPMSVDYSTLVSGLGLGTHEICVTASGSDADGGGSVTECVTIRVVAEEPTAITLASFSVEANNGQAVVRWETGTEINNAGFNLYRATSPDGSWTKINAALIGAQGDPVSGAKYSFVDIPGRGTFYYRLEDVDFFGMSTKHESVMVEMGPVIRLPWYRPVLPVFD